MEKDTNWESVLERLIEECRGLSFVHKEDSKVAKNSCTDCNRPGHRATYCWINPANPNNRLDLLRDVPQNKDKTDKKSDNGKLSASSTDKQEKKKKSKKRKHRYAMTRVSTNSETNKMMLDSRTYAHMTPKLEKVVNTRDCNVTKALGDDSTVSATEKVVRKVCWQGSDGRVTVPPVKLLLRPTSQ